MKRWTVMLLGMSLLACQPGNPSQARRPTLQKVAAKASVRPAPAPRVASPQVGAAPTRPSPPPPLATATPRPTAAPVSAGGGSSGGGASGPTPTPSPVLGLVADAQPAGTWQAGPTLQRPRAGLVAAALGDRLLALEGENTPSLEQLDPDAPYWALDTTHNQARGGSADVVLSNGRAWMALGQSAGALYTLGGRSDALSQTDIHRYGPNGLEALVAGCRVPVDAPAGGLIGTSLLLAGGVAQGGTLVSLVQVVNVTNGAQAWGTAMPRAVAGAASAVLDGKLYVLGGYTLTGDGTAIPVSHVQVYDATAKSWRWSGDGRAGAPAALPAARHSAASTVLGGKIYLAGGVRADGQPVGPIAAFDPAANAWRTGTDMLEPRSLLGLAAYQGRLWAIGGVDAAGRELASVEVYRP
jgi:hypothetical protein